jgi:ActD protein
VRPGVLAEFASADAMLEAVAVLRRHGYQDVETYSPSWVDGVARRLGLGGSRLPRFVFGGGLIGALLGYGIQWYANVYDYPYDVGGRPVHSVLAFMPATFEAAVLCAALVAFVGLCVALRLPTLWHPVFEVEGFERASADRYWVGIEGAEEPLDLDRIRVALAVVEPVGIVRVDGSQ